MTTTPTSASSHRLVELVRKLGNDAYRASYLATRLKTFLASQIRSLRGEASQAEFGKKLGKPQSVVSRLENPDYGNLSVQTLLEVADKLKLALIIQFIDWPTFLRFTEETTPASMTPAAFDQEKVDALVVPQTAGVALNVPTFPMNALIGIAGLGDTQMLTLTEVQNALTILQAPHHDRANRSIQVATWPALNALYAAPLQEGASYWEHEPIEEGLPVVHLAAIERAGRAQP